LLTSSWTFWRERPKILSQATWSKSENLLRNSSQVLASAEHYLSATGAILQDLEGEGIAEIKSLLLQLDKALGTSQVLVSGALANLTLSKRSEISDKPSVNETLKDSLMKSSLMDTMFGLSLQKVQEEVSKAPQSVSSGFVTSWDQPSQSRIKDLVILNIVNS
jgi:hypothetical protein